MDIDVSTMVEEQRLRKRAKAKRARRRRAVFTLILIILLLAAITACGYYAYQYKMAQTEIEEARLDASESEEKYNNLVLELKNGGYVTAEDAEYMISEAIAANTEDIKQQIRFSMEGNETTLTMLEKLFEDKIVVPADGKYNFFEVDPNLAPSNIDFDSLVYPVLNEETDKYEGEASYSTGEVTARKGVDVSKFQEKINWEKVKGDGVEWAYIRMGYRGYTEGELFLDDKYEDNIEACNKLGIDCGVYFFTEAKNTEEAREEAEYVIEHLDGYHTELPIVIDVEESANPKKSRTKNLTKEERTDIVIAFCEAIKEAGYDVMIYGNLKSFMIMMDITRLEDYDKWFAYYHYPLRFPYKIKIWQYSATRSVNGIKGEADLNLMFY